mmetsp:Transcript_36441/g.72064  ORF Transcript_36441/g.72064 Transcript_36441/m.72064 type:complete len:244 (-) Transcript_36441:2056-2787(-)
MTFCRLPSCALVAAATLLRAPFKSPASFRKLPRSSMRRRRSPSSVIHSNSQPCRSQSARSRASSQSSRSTSTLPVAPLDFSSTSTHLCASWSVSCLESRRASPGRTSAQTPQLWSDSASKPPRHLSLNSALLPGSSLHAQVSELAGPQPEKCGIGLASGNEKIKVTSDIPKRAFGFFLSTSSCNDATFPGLCICVLLTSSTQSWRTPAAWAGPLFTKASTCICLLASWLVKRFTSDPTICPFS